MAIGPIHPLISIIVASSVSNSILNLPANLFASCIVQNINGIVEKNVNRKIAINLSMSLIRLEGDLHLGVGNSVKIESSSNNSHIKLKIMPIGNKYIL